MLTAGSVGPNGEWLQAQSLARSMEQALIAAGLVDLDEETLEATDQRRRTYAAMAAGIVDYMKTHMEIEVRVGDLRGTGETGSRVPASSKEFTVSGGKITIPTGGLRGMNDTQVRVPLTTRTLSGRVK